MGKVRPYSRKRDRRIRWLFFKIEPETAKILFFLALVGILFTSFAMIWMVFNLLSALSYLGYLQGATGQAQQTSYMSAYASYYSSSVLMYYVLYSGLLFFVWILELITLIQCSKARNM